MSCHDHAFCTDHRHKNQFCADICGGGFFPFFHSAEELAFFYCLQLMTVLILRFCVQYYRSILWILLFIAIITTFQGAKWLKMNLVLRAVNVLVFPCGGPLTAFLYTPSSMSLSEQNISIFILVGVCMPDVLNAGESF